MDIRCPECNTPLVRKFDGAEGAQAEGYCQKHKIEVFVRRRVRSGKEALKNPGVDKSTKVVVNYQ